MTSNKNWASNIIAGAATVHEGLFLLLKRSSRESFLPNAWGIPACEVEPGEDPCEACLRELYEETGLHGQVVDLVGYANFVSRRAGTNLSNVQLNFLVKVDDCDVKLNLASHSDLRWISLDDVDSDLLDTFTRNIMISARRHYKEARVQ